MAIKKIRMRPEGTNDYEDVLHPETSAEQVKLTSSNFVAKDVKTGMDELFTNVSNGKNLIASAITDKGVITSGGHTFSQMAANIKSIETDMTGDANATVGDILSGKTAYVKGQKLSGSMPNRGNVSKTITTQGGSFSVPAGYYTGGSVKAQFANLSAGNIKSGVTVGGVKGNYKQSVTTSVTSRAAPISRTSTNTTIHTGIQIDKVFVVVSDPAGQDRSEVKLVSRGEVWNVYDKYYKVNITFNTSGSLVCYTYTDSMSGLGNYVYVSVAYGVAQ